MLHLGVIQNDAFLGLACANPPRFRNADEGRKPPDREN